MRDRANITEAHGDLIVLEMLRNYFRARLRSEQNKITKDVYLSFIAKLSVMIDKAEALDKHLATMLYADIDDANKLIELAHDLVEAMYE